MKVAVVQRAQISVCLSKALCLCHGLLRYNLNTKIIQKTKKIDDKAIIGQEEQSQRSNEKATTMDRNRRGAQENKKAETWRIMLLVDKASLGLGLGVGLALGSRSRSRLGLGLQLLVES
jgi:hypothetical protein